MQIGNAITEKMVLDVILQARDRGLFHAITDCGAGGFSSAVGEMGAELGAEVDLDRAPLKYEGLSYTEIWISEAQERMVLAVPPENWPALQALCRREGVEATDLGRVRRLGPADAPLSRRGRSPTCRWTSCTTAGRPSSARRPGRRPPSGRSRCPRTRDFTADLLALLAHWDVCSKEWIVRQYDHEVQAPDGDQAAGRRRATTARATRRWSCRCAARLAAWPSAAGSTRATASSTPTRWPAASSTRRSATAWPSAPTPSGSPSLDNFCWGNTERPETLGSLVLAAQACHDVALAYGTPFISGKDSLNNEYTHDGTSLAIPPTLLISAIGQVPDVRPCVTMDLKEPGNLLLLLGHDPARAGRLALVPTFIQQDGGPRAPGRPRAGPARASRPSTRRSRAAWSGAATT